jgi:hypothetical protein
MKFPGIDPKRVWSVFLSGDQGWGVTEPRGVRLFSSRRSRAVQSPGIDTSTTPAVLTVSSRERVITLTGAEASGAGGPSTAGIVIQEPASRGSAPGIFLVAAYLLARDPEAVALLLPSTYQPLYGHTSHEELAALVRAADCSDKQMVLLGAAPARPQSGLGWVEPGQLSGSFSSVAVRSIVRCHERPSEAEAKMFLKKGFFWNTMVVATKVRTLWRVGRQLFGNDVMRRFDNLLDLLKLVLSGKAGPELQTLALRDVYRGLETLNLWRPLLEQAADFMVVLPGQEIASRTCGKELRQAPESHVSIPSSAFVNSA